MDVLYFVIEQFIAKYPNIKVSIHWDRIENPNAPPAYIPGGGSRAYNQDGSYAEVQEGPNLRGDK